VDHLIDLAREDPDLVVGLDFAFSLPAWFLGERGLETARELWELVAAEGEVWLERCEPPFWGRTGSTKPADVPVFRETERRVRSATGARPKSVFQIAGPGAVGTGSLRGMPHLLRLAEAGFSVWPFDGADLPLVVEIYPRLFSVGVVKSDPEARRRYLERRYPRLAPETREEAARSSDAFDAAVSALAMDRHRPQLTSLEPAEDPRVRKEGRIWWPEGTTSSPRRVPILERGLVYTSRLHADQTRKGPDGTPYVAHLLGVCSLTLEAGGDEEQAAAALLHDAAEDQGGRERLEEIRARFGDRVARIVEGCTDTFEAPKPDWRPRKEAYVARLGEESAEVLFVACADKLYNARAILRDHRRVGDEVFRRFRAEREGTLWYYRAVADAFVDSELDSWLVDELERTVAELERRAARL